jgi:hypothetical protein
MKHPGIEAIRNAPRCHAMSKQAKRRCRQPVVPGRNVCHWHGGRAGAPKGHVNSLVHGDRMREDRIAKKAGTAAGRAIRGMIRNTMEGFKRQLPAAEVHARHAALVEQVAQAKAIQVEANRQKQERILQHYARQEAKEAKRKADRRARRATRPPKSSK